MDKSEDGGIITCQFYARLGASFALDPSVVPANAVFKPKPQPMRRWDVADGPCGKMIFFIVYGDDGARGVGVFTKMSRDAASEVCAYARRALALPDSTAFEESWTAYTSHCNVSGSPIWIKGHHGNAPVRVSIHGGASSICARTFSDLKHVAAAIMHREPFAPVGERFFGMDSDELHRISRCAAENVTFQWYTYPDPESDEPTPGVDGWPSICDGALLHTESS